MATTVWLTILRTRVRSWSGDNCRYCPNSGLCSASWTASCSGCWADEDPGNCALSGYAPVCPGTVPRGIGGCCYRNCHQDTIGVDTSMISRSGVYKNYIRGAVDVACHVREDVCSLCDVYDEFVTYIEILAFVGVEVGLPQGQVKVKVKVYLRLCRC